MSDSVQPRRQQPSRLPHPWDSPGKNNGVGCHFLLQCMKVKSESEVAQSCPTLSDPMDCSLSGSSVHGIFQARVLELYAQYLWKLYTNWKTGSPWMEEPQGSYLDSPSPKRTLIICVTELNYKFSYAYWGITTGLLIIVHC